MTNSDRRLMTLPELISRPGFSGSDPLRFPWASEGMVRILIIYIYLKCLKCLKCNKVSKNNYL